jgi:hypothetical protein
MIKIFYEAIENYDIALQFNANNTLAILSKAQCLIYLKKYDESLKLIEEAK